MKEKEQGRNSKSSVCILGLWRVKVEKKGGREKKNQGCYAFRMRERGRGKECATMRRRGVSTMKTRAQTDGAAHSGGPKCGKKVEGKIWKGKARLRPLSPLGVKT